MRAVEQHTDGSTAIHDPVITGGSGKFDINFTNLNRLVVFVIEQTRYTDLPRFLPHGGRAINRDT